MNNNDDDHHQWNIFYIFHLMDHHHHLNPLSMMMNFFIYFVFSLIHLFIHFFITQKKVLDLLNPTTRPLMVRWSKDRGFYAENLFKVECEDLGDLEGVLEEGLFLFVSLNLTVLLLLSSTE